ncbi:glycoside hydrolase [Hortaea werneckii]|nr:glycoside hydrolase [Hortaea werneckii]
MKRFFDKAKSFVDDNDFPGKDHASKFISQQQQQHGGGGGGQQPLQPGQPPAGGIQPPSPADVTRYRYHHGANFGSLFILERWLCGHMFPEGSEGSSERAAVKAWVKKEGIDSTRERFEKHWNEWIRDSDLEWLRDNKCTTIRLPIGYFTLGPAYCKDTAFEKYSAVYENAWEAVKKLIHRCHSHGIGVVIDLHGLPGGANPQDHSGTNSGKAEFWSTRSYRELGTRCLCFIAHQSRSMEGVAGLQIINEAEWDAKGMYDWYDSAIAEISKVDPTMPVYVSDAWDLNRCLDWSQKKNSPRNAFGCPVVVDTHYYWCFSDADKQKTPQDISQEVWHKMGPLDGKAGSVIDKGAAQVIVGEYSCVLSDPTWENGGGKNDDLVRQFGNAESGRFQQKAGGTFFWTYRMDWMDGGEWGFKQMTDCHAIVPPQALTVYGVNERIQHAQQGMEQAKHTAFSNHAGYWDSQGGHYEHQRFADGWDIGFHDAMSFFGMRGQQSGGQLGGGDKIGMLDIWVLKRMRESGQGGGFVWEWEQGFRQGVSGFCHLAGI